MPRTKQSLKKRAKAHQKKALATRLRKNKIKGLRARHRSARKRKKTTRATRKVKAASKRG
jgi:hypothetical protein